MGRLGQGDTGSNSDAMPYSFLNYEDDEQTVASKSDVVKSYVWGLNDKDQLGGVKGSKVKFPTYAEQISRLNPSSIVCGSKSVFILTNDGKVYSCGEGSNGRLGIGHSDNVSQPRLITTLSAHIVKKIAVHPGGRHCLALTTDGKVYSWGEGEDGKLGHGNKNTVVVPKLIEELKNKRMRDIACGSSHSASISSNGELFTWGKH